MHVPVLTYHSVNIIRNTYAENDHIVFRKQADLEPVLN